nr:unnamed protein product [Callosobruchus analis]
MYVKSEFHLRQKGPTKAPEMYLICEEKDNDDTFRRQRKSLTSPHLRFTGRCLSSVPPIALAPPLSPLPSSSLDAWDAIGCWRCCRMYS